MRTPLDLLLTERSLRLIRSNGDGDLPESLLEQSLNLPSPIVKNMCAKVSSHLVERLDETCNLLDISKRKFIETAVIEALNRADQIMSEEGVWSAIEDYHKSLEAAGVPADALVITEGV